jgi:hypothetical protein
MMQDSLSFTDPIPSDLQQRIAAARKNKSLSGCARAVLNVLADPLSPHAGMTSAICIASLQRKWTNLTGRCWNDREIKGAVEELRVTYRIPVGSSRRKPYGYFLAVTDEELQATAEVYISQALSMLKHATIFSPRSNYVRHRLRRLELEDQ